MSLRTPRPGERGFQDWKDLADAFDAIGGVPACGALAENHIEPPQEEPAPVANLHPKTADLVQRFATALAEKLAAAEKKYGYSDGWASSDWMGECRLKLREHLLKGDPRDVAAYCAFLWHHGESTALPIEEAEQLFRAPEPAQAADSVLEDAARQPQLKVRLTAFPESNGKQNWTALLVRSEPWNGLVGNCGGISLARGELWNRVAYEAECARFLIGERDTEPYILDYAKDIKTPDEWAGEREGGRMPLRAARKQGGA